MMGMSELPLEHIHIGPDNAGNDNAAAVILHGRGADEEDLLPIARSLPDHLHIVSLRAPDRLQGGYTWYELDLSGGGIHQSQPDATDFDRSRRLVTESIDAAVDRYGIAPDHIGLLGFSQGAITSLSLLVDSPDRYRWVVALHGYLPDSHNDVDPEGIADKPVFIAAGRADEIIPAARSEAAANRFETLGATVEYTASPGGHGIGPAEHEELVEFVAEQVT
jgi:phospholipase/carboxylesterase